MQASPLGDRNSFAFAVSDQSNKRVDRLHNSASLNLFEDRSLLSE